MKTQIIIYKISFFFLLLSINVKGQATDPINAFPSVELLAEEFLNKTKLPGLSIAVSKNEELIFAKAFGYADVKNEIPVELDTRFRAASVSKVLTATAIAKLVSAGKLNLDAPISKYIPDLNPSYAPLTIRQIANHTSGLKHRHDGRSFSRKEYTTKQNIDLMRQPLLFESGTDYRYSTAGFNLLAAAIESVSGKSFTKYMEDEIFKPLGIQDTQAETIKELNNKDAKLYHLKKGKLKKEKKLSNGTLKLAGAGFRTTPIDLVKMMNAYSNGFISEDTVNEMFKKSKLKDGRKIQIGVAWRCSTDAFGNEVIEHSGNWQGARSVVVYYPKEKLSIAIMINARCSVFIEEMAHIIAQQFLNNEEKEIIQNIISKKVKVELKLSDGTTAEYEGNLNMENGIGKLKVDREANFINTNPIYYLGFGNHYTIVTNFGLLYLKAKNEFEFQAEVYLYGSMNKANPTNQEPILTFNTY